MTEDEKRINNIEMKYLKTKSDVNFDHTLSKFDDINNQLEHCTKLMIILAVLSFVIMFLVIVFSTYLILTR